jgi:hypothetical protein
MSKNDASGGTGESIIFLSIDERIIGFFLLKIQGEIA